MTPEKPWKRIERQEAEKLGGKRIPVGTLGAPDIETPWLCVEVKARKHLPAWITDAVRSARGKAKHTQLGIALLHEMGQYDSYIVMSRCDFIDWFGGGKEAK